jgi:uncharacterized membrane protein
LAFFSDAVFAIAITLLVIEFQVPRITRSSTIESVWTQLAGLKYNLFSLLVSFVLISKYWIRHHFLFKHICNYNKQIVIANLSILLPVIFFPFTTAFFGESMVNDSVVILALQLFLLNHILAGLTTYTFYWLTLVKYKQFSFPMSTEERSKFRSDTLYLTFVFTGIFILTLLTCDRRILLWTILLSLFSKKIISVLFYRAGKKNSH